jgi:hypothetical protein
MKTFAAALLLLPLLAFATQIRADDEPEKVKIEFKSGESTPDGCVLKDVTEAGVTLVGNDGVPMFIKWSYTRGDKHFDLRKRACNFKSLSSIISLADFCHDFALDRKEVETLIEGLKLAPTDATLKSRLAALPKYDDLKAPDPEVKPPDEKPIVPDKPDDPPKQPDPTPEVSQLLKIESNEADIVAPLTKELEKLGYKIAAGKDYDVLIKLEVDLKLIKNPKWMGAELYAIYDGTAKYQLFTKADKASFDDKTVESKNVRSNKDKADAKKMILEELSEKLKDPIHNALRRKKK